MNIREYISALYDWGVASYACGYRVRGGSSMYRSVALSLLCLVGAVVPCAAACASDIVDRATDEFGALSEAELRFFSAVRDQVPAVFLSDDDARNDSADAATWDHRRVLDASRVNWLVRQPDAHQLLARTGLALVGCRIDGDIDVNMTTVSYPIVFVRCALEGTVDLRQGTIDKLLIEHTHVRRIWADSLTVTDVFFVRNGTVVQEELRLIGATVGGPIDLSTAQFGSAGTQGSTRSDEPRVNLSNAVVHGDLVIRGTVVHGTVRLVGATVDGEVSFMASQLLHPSGIALYADRLLVRQSLFLQGAASGGQPLAIGGRVSLVGAKIRGSLGWANVQPAGTMQLDLRNAEVGVLRDKEADWPGPGQLLLDGLTYDRIGDNVTRDPEARIRWIHRQPTDRYRPQPYSQLAEFLRSDGDEIGATAVLIAREREHGARAKIPLAQKLVWFWTFGKLIGFGYRPWRALWIALPVIAGCAVLYHLCRAQIRSPNCQGRSFNALMYSLDVFVPLMNLRMEEHWIPDPADGLAARVMRWCMWFEMLAGWLLTTLFAAALTGIVT